MPRQERYIDVATFTFDDLIAWSANLPDWQRDALRRVLTSTISPNDVTELAEMAKAVHGGNAPPTSPVLATSNHVRPSNAALSPVSLLSLREISRVNALAPGPVSFPPDGLTVIYGENASGKSGITRILKKACRAREPGGTIRPSVFDPPNTQPASAVLKYRINVQETEFAWQDGGPTHDDLATINVFDGDCAVGQIEKANRLSYTPEILQVFSDLAAACDQVATRLRAERARLQTPAVQLSTLALQPGTPAGVLAGSLSKDTDPNRVDSLCQFTPDQERRKAELTRILQDKPIERARAADARRARLEEAARKCAAWIDTFSDTALETFETQLAEGTAAKTAAESARTAFATNSNLAGLGTAEWRQFWESARRYSETHAYPEREFPVAENDVLCVLCQQPLGTGAGSRLHAFEHFVRSDLQQRADSHERALHSARASIASVVLPFSRKLLQDTELLDTDAGQQLKRFLVLSKLRRRYLLRLADGRQAPIKPTFATPPDLTELQEVLRQESERLRAAANAEERQKMEQELGELSDYERIAPLKSAIHAEVGRLVLLNVLDRAIGDCNTARITRKAGDVERVIVTATLRNEFNQNLAALGFAAPTALEVQLGPGQYGEHPHHLALTVKPDVPPTDILSDGEKRCVGLAGFLAELDTTKNCSALVLDDPVCSLDHRYRDRVANQLVSRARSRQVIILTHDIVFLRMLQKHSRTAGVALHEVVINRGSRLYGIPSEGPPWIAMRIKQRLGILRNELQAAEALLNKGDRPSYEQKAEWIYGKLRTSWERALEELLLNEVVVRFGDEVQTQRLRRLTDISDNDVTLVDEQMSRCSRFMHDQAGAVNEPVPEPDVLRDDIKRLADWVDDLRKRGRG